MNKKHIKGIILSLAILLISCSKGEKSPKLIADTDEIVRFELVSWVDTVLHRNTPDCQDIRYGFEGGRIVKVGNTYHWITAEMVGDPTWVDMRLGHWTSVDGIDWQRQSTVRASDGDYTGVSQRASVFGPMTVFVEEDNRWHLVYVCYKAKPDEPNTFWRNHDGIIQHAVSAVEGIEGIGGPYEDKNVLMRYDDHPDSWEGLQGTDSFFPYKIGNKWYAFYGSATTQDLANCQWLIGLAQSDKIEGPWVRMSERNPVNLNDFAENPIVTQLENGVYIAIVDGGSGENKLGYTLSWDGINWSTLRYFKIEPAVKKWWSQTRTPLSLIKENDGTYTLFFTAFKPYEDVTFGALGKLTFKVTFPEGSFIPYSFAPNAPIASSYSATLNGTPYYVYPVPKRANGDGNSGLDAELVTFGINGRVEVKIKSSTSVSSVKIRPLSAGITPVVQNDTISFTLTKPQNLSIEVNGNINKPLFIFANAPETNVPDKNDPNVIFFEEGKVYEKGLFNISSNQTVYIAPGAIVRGAMITDQTEHVRITGHGILSGEQLIHGQTRMIEINRAKNVTVEGITVVASSHWTIPLTACENAEVRDVKMVSDADWDDGIDVVGSKNVVVDNCFIRTKDDCIAIKSGVNYFTDFDAQIRVENIRVKNSTMWNGTYGNCLEIGFETRTDTIKDVIFENIDLIHNQNPGHSNESAITIHNGDRTVVDNILYKNIRIEDPEWALIDFRILKSEYSRDTERGKISNIRFEDINVTSSGTVRSYMYGFDATHDIKNIHIKNMKVNGNKILTSSELNLLTNHLTNLTFE